MASREDSAPAAAGVAGPAGVTGPNGAAGATGTADAAGTAGTATPGRTPVLPHPVVFLDYRIRVAGYLVVGAGVASALLEERPGARVPGALLWTLLLLHALAWPHVAFLFARAGRGVRGLERVLLGVDGFLGGIWLAMTGLALWPSAVLAFTLLASGARVGGPRALATCIATLAAGGCAAAIVGGFTFVPQTGLRTSLFCLAGILGYGITYALMLKRQARSIAAADRERAALLEHLQVRSAALASSLERLQALHEVTIAIGSSIELPVVLETVVRNAAQVVGADACAILELEPGTTVFRLLAGRGLGADFLARMAATEVDIQDRVIREAIDGKKPVQVPDLETGPAFLLRGIALAAGFRGLLAVPVVQPQITRGLMLLRRAPGPFDEDGVTMLVALAGQAAVAIEHADLYRRLQAQQASLEAASRAKSDFLANMSHELRTPLNAILGYTELIREETYGAVPPKMGDVLQRVERSARRLLEMINGVLEIARIEAGNLALQRQPCDLVALVREVAAAMEPAAREKNLRLAVTLPSQAMPAAVIDRRQLAEVLYSLVGNAIRHSPQGEVEVAASVDREGFVVAVRDSGAGAADADRERIAGAFDQAGGTAAVTQGGAGLGLAITRRIVELHGGRLWVESQAGAGSTFRFSLSHAGQGAGTIGAVQAAGIVAAGGAGVVLRGAGDVVAAGRAPGASA